MARRPGGARRPDPRRATKSGATARLRWLLVPAALVVAAASFLVLGVGRTDRAAAPTTQSSASSTTPGPVDAARAQVFTDALASGDGDAVQSVVALPPDQAIESEAVTQLAVDGPVIFDPATFVDNGDGTATISAVGGSPAQAWEVSLLDVDGSWLIALTRTPS